ncbi:BTAD domain-containing putative transcriptional regulator [Actinokineospora pegani]|uniref:BTAD domain-containing putative transcriptional regulator n=1 Tax=Actinokineospora pegani TaxID=2654637 RepID=UPI0022A7EED3|nr:BTAD domain-containing putative transcriptional regulator [Actinokineospora pegani]
MTWGGRSVPLGGVKQRATLGFLLLKANQVVPTSTLLKALWTEEEVPASARKMLQNAVWGLRAALGAAGCADVQLSTQSPGYVLKVDPELLDLHQFTSAASEGRSLLAAGEYERAAVVLGTALSVWRGAALADLAEIGVCWMELGALETSRLAALEDYFDAELGCGRHHEVLADLQALVETERLRERACRQLMLALYRCGRHADASAVYAKLRSALVDDLGLEPGPEVRALQQAILNHDPVLAAAPRPREQVGPVAETAASEQADPTPVMAGVALPRAVAPPAPAASTGPPPSPAAERTPEAPAASPAAGADEPGAVPRPRTPDAASPHTAPVPKQRKRVTLALVRVALGECHDLTEESDVDDMLAGAVSLARTGIEQLGGQVVAALGSTVLAVFSSPREHDAALRAVRAAGLLRESLGGPERGVVVTAALTTGEVLLRARSSDPDGPLVPHGALVDRCQDLLPGVPPGQVWLCPATHALVRDFTGCAPIADGHWALLGPHGDAAAAGYPDQDSELAVVCGLLDRTRRRRRPHLITVVDVTSRTSRSFTSALEGLVDGEDVLLVRGRCTDDDVLTAHAGALASLCGIGAGDDPAEVQDKVEAALRRGPATPFEGTLLAKRLTPLFFGRACDPSPSLLTAWQAFLEHTANNRAIVVVLEDVHYAHDAVLQWIEHWVSTALATPLLVVVTASGELAARRPDWGATVPHAASITLDHCDDQDTERLRHSILRTVDECERPLAHRLLTAPAHRSEHAAVVPAHLSPRRGTRALPVEVPPSRLLYETALSRGAREAATT